MNNEYILKYFLGNTKNEQQFQQPNGENRNVPEF